MDISGSCLKCKKKSPAAKELKADEINHLDSNCVRVKFKKGKSIFKQGIFSSNIIYLTEGVVKIHIEEEEKEQIIMFAKSPSYIGIPTVIAEKINQYSATTITDSSVCIINKDVFKTFIENNGKFAFEILTELCCNELKFYKLNVANSQKLIQGRLADILLYFSEEIFDSPNFSIPISRKEMGSYINAARESISRIFSEFTTENIIDISGRKIKILNKELLKKISSTG